MRDKRSPRREQKPRAVKTADLRRLRHWLLHNTNKIDHLQAIIEDVRSKPRRRPYSYYRVKTASSSSMWCPVTNRQ